MGRGTGGRPTGPRAWRRRRWCAALVVLLAGVGLPAARARTADGPASCEGVAGSWDGRTGRGSLCIAVAGRTAAYVGGNVPAACGTVLVGGLNLLDGPTAGPGPDAAACPHHGGGPVDVHDPVIAEEDGAFYLFATGPGIPVRRSDDLRTWTPIGPALADGLPPWAAKAVPGVADPWAPDVSWFGGRWHLYYALSTFGSKVSAIGHATSPTLDPAAPGYGWVDEGAVVRSDLLTDHNAIDPSVLVDGDQVWLTWGSFWGGIKQARLDPATGRLDPTTPPVTVASRLVPSWGIEAPTLVRHGPSYYLFTSFDHCCRGSASTYHVRVGRARSPQGPFLDADGVPLLAGGGTVVLATEGSRRGPGHQAVLRHGDEWSLAFHWYDAERGGLARLGLLPITWTADGWPTVTWDDLAP